MLNLHPRRALILVAVAIIAGLVAASHMGKVPAALPDITHSLQLSLPEAGLVVSVFSLLAAVFGTLVGVISARIGRISAGTIGLAAIAGGAFLGGVSQNYGLLLGSRIIEGLGFVLIAVTMPGLINALCPPRHKAIAMGIWGAFIPAAMCLMLLVTPGIIEQSGWQQVWLLTALLSVTWLGVFSFGFRATAVEETTALPLFAQARKLLSRRPVAVVIVFICYSAMFAAVTAFLPTYWTNTLHLDIHNASYMSALVVSGNIAGNIVAGIATGRGIPMQRLFMFAFVVGGGAAVLLFQAQDSFTATLLLALTFTFFSGLIPGAVFANIAALVPQPAAIPLMVGLIFQGAGIGQVCGPLLLATTVEWSGSWNAAGLVIAALVLVGVVSSSSTRAE